MTLNEQTIIGTWSMIEAWDIGDDPNDPQKKTYPWGNPSAGYWVFDKSGHFSLMISQNPPLPIPLDPFAGTPQPAWLNPAAPWRVPQDLLVESFAKASPYAYFGSYTVEMDTNSPHLGGTLVMTVFADIMRAYTGTVQRRPFLFDGPDHLNVGASGEYLRRLQRLS
jgi:hypothetical protein